MATLQAVKKFASLWRNCGRFQMTLLWREIVYGRCGKLFSASGKMGLFHVEHSELTRLLLSPQGSLVGLRARRAFHVEHLGEGGQTVPL